jgi:UDP-N-acetylmuramoyl-tripeptide--D-alanyl-D-alanine ligase
MKSILKIVVVSVLTWEAKLVLKKYKPKIVAVTGSVGKTSTKDAIASVLSHFFFVRKSEKSFNSEIGVPLTVLDCPNGWSNPFAWLKNIFEGLALIVLPNHYPEWLVLEVGADRPRDIQNLTRWVKPDIAVITRLSKVPVHVEFFSSPAQVFEEKGRLAEALKRDGTLVLNADDEDVLAFRPLTESPSILYGLTFICYFVARS